MFTRFRSKNLKVWSDQLWERGVELAPVTLFLGSNSAGKTSLLQLPLLLKQTFESPDRHLDLNLGGQSTDLLDLGTFADVVHGHDTRRELGLGLTFEDRRAPPGSPSRFDYEAAFGLVGPTPTLLRMRYTEGSRTYAVERRADGAYRLEAPGRGASPEGGAPDARPSLRPERSVAFSAEAVAALGEEGARAQDLSLRLTRALGRVAYLGPLRERPERHYQWGSRAPVDLGPRGERAVQALLASANSSQPRRESEEGGQGWLVERVSDWLSRMGVADSLQLERQGSSRFYEVVVTTHGRRASVVDVGFGISQVLPMLVLAFYVEPGTTIIAEQPEIHLHPRAQVGLAELMAEVARERRVQFLVETHSEHLFRRLQYLVADEQLTTRDCRLYFVDQGSDGTAELRQLEMDAFGRIANWPPGFFGDVVGETERQMRRMVERLRAGR